MSNPEWFEKTIGFQAESRSVRVGDANINYLIWGNDPKPFLFFIHGYCAHAHWWDFIAPHFLDSFNVIAIDLSGMGDSGHRSVYSQDLYSDEIQAVCSQEEVKSAIFLAHSMGGSIAVNAAARYPDLFESLILIDSIVVVPPDKIKDFSSRKSTWRQDFFYDSLDDAIKSFRLIPPQPCKNDFLIQHIANFSFREKDNTWKLKSDGKIMKTYDSQDLTQGFMDLKCPIYLVYGLMRQIFSQELLDYTVYVGNIPQEKIIGIPGAMHHVFIDEPILFIEAVKKLINGGETSD